MTQVGQVTGQSRLVVDINRTLESKDRPAVLLRGPSGAGKTWVAQSVAESWRDSGGVAFVATGDELFRRRPHFPLLLAVSAETGRAQSKAATKLALEPLNAIPIGGKPLREILHQLFERKDSHATARTPYLRQDDREIFMRIQKVASTRRVLLICDNLQWWDDASLEMLGLAFAPQTRAAFPFLEKVAVLALHTTESQAEESATLQTILTSHLWRTFVLGFCKPSDFDELLRAFGIRSTMPRELVDRLFVITGGHLDLVRRIAEADVKAFSAHLLGPAETKTDFLFSLLEQRLERHTPVPEETASVLRAAAVIGNSFAEHELDCLVRSDAENIGRLLEPAERLRILERSGKVRTFAHDLVRTYYLQHAKTRREELHQRFADCLRLIHAGDYARRAEHLRRSNNLRGAGEVVALECLREMRAGVEPVLEVLRDELETDLMSYVATMHRAQNHFDAGRYDDAISALLSVEGLYSEVLLAERDILQARCHIKRLSRLDRERAREILSRWISLKDTETEVWGRAMVYLVVACVFLSDEVRAVEVERTLYQALAARVSFDPTARRTVNHIRLKSNMLHSVHVARERLSRAIEFFGGVGGLAVYDPVHQYIGLVNLAANYLVEGEFDEAFAVSQQATALSQSEGVVTFARADILVTNLTIAGYFGGRLSVTEALAAATSSWQAFRDSNDSPLLASNIGFYLARDSRHNEAVDLLEPIFRSMLERPDIDSYYLYFVGNNLSGSLFMQGRTTESEAIWTTITPFVREFIGPVSPYIRRRHEIQSRIFSTDQQPLDWDNFPAATPQVGPGWKFYGRGFLASELEFWSDE